MVAPVAPPCKQDRTDVPPKRSVKGGNQNAPRPGGPSGVKTGGGTGSVGGPRGPQNPGGRGAGKRVANGSANGGRSGGGSTNQDANSTKAYAQLEQQNNPLSGPHQREETTGQNGHSGALSGDLSAGISVNGAGLPEVGSRAPPVPPSVAAPGNGPSLKPPLRSFAAAAAGAASSSLPPTASPRVTPAMSSAPNAPEVGALQFGSFSPNNVAIHIPPRTSSAPPILDEQIRAREKQSQLERLSDHQKRQQQQLQPPQTQPQSKGAIAGSESVNQRPPIQLPLTTSETPGFSQVLSVPRSNTGAQAPMPAQFLVPIPNQAKSEAEVQQFPQARAPHVHEQVPLPQGHSQVHGQGQGSHHHQLITQDRKLTGHNIGPMRSNKGQLHGGPNQGHTMGTGHHPQGGGSGSHGLIHGQQGVAGLVPPQSQLPQGIPPGGPHMGPPLQQQQQQAIKFALPGGQHGGQHGGQQQLMNNSHMHQVGAHQVGPGVQGYGPSGGFSQGGYNLSQVPPRVSKAIKIFDPVSKEEVKLEPPLKASKKPETTSGVASGNESGVGMPVGSPSGVNHGLRPGSSSGMPVPQRPPPMPYQQPPQAAYFGQPQYQVPFFGQSSQVPQKPGPSPPQGTAGVLPVQNRYSTGFSSQGMSVQGMANMNQYSVQGGVGLGGKPGPNSMGGGLPGGGLPGGGNNDLTANGVNSMYYPQQLGPAMLAPQPMGGLPGVNLRTGPGVPHQLPAGGMAQSRSTLPGMAGGKSGPGIQVREREAPGSQQQKRPNKKSGNQQHRQQHPGVQVLPQQSGGQGQASSQYISAGQIWTQTGPQAGGDDVPRMAGIHGSSVSSSAGSSPGISAIGVAPPPSSWSSPNMAQGRSSGISPSGPHAVRSVPTGQGSRASGGNTPVVYANALPPSQQTSGASIRPVVTVSADDTAWAPDGGQMPLPPSNSVGGMHPRGLPQTVQQHKKEQEKEVSLADVPLVELPASFLCDSSSASLASSSAHTESQHSNDRDATVKQEVREQGRRPDLTGSSYVNNERPPSSPGTVEVLSSASPELEVVLTDTIPGRPVTSSFEDVTELPPTPTPTPYHSRNSSVSDEFNLPTGKVAANVAHERTSAIEEGNSEGVHEAADATQGSGATLSAREEETGKVSDIEEKEVEGVEVSEKAKQRNVAVKEPVWAKSVTVPQAQNLDATQEWPVLSLSNKPRVMKKASSKESLSAGDRPQDSVPQVFIDSDEKKLSDKLTVPHGKKKMNDKVGVEAVMDTSLLVGKSAVDVELVQANLMTGSEDIVACQAGGQPLGEGHSVSKKDVGAGEALFQEIIGAKEEGECGVAGKETDTTILLSSGFEPGDVEETKHVRLQGAGAAVMSAIQSESVTAEEVTSPSAENIVVSEHVQDDEVDSPSVSVDATESVGIPVSNKQVLDSSSDTSIDVEEGEIVGDGEPLLEPESTSVGSVLADSLKVEADGKESMSESGPDVKSELTQLVEAVATTVEVGLSAIEIHTDLEVVADSQAMDEAEREVVAEGAGERTVEEDEGIPHVSGEESLEGDLSVRMENERASSNSGIASTGVAAAGSKKKKKKDMLAKADAAGNTSDLYNAYKAPEEGKIVDAIEKPDKGVKTELSKEVTKKSPPARIEKPPVDELDNWEDTADIQTPKVEAKGISGAGREELISGENENEGEKKRTYTRDFLFTLQHQCGELTLEKRTAIGDDLLDKNPLPSPKVPMGRVIDRSRSQRETGLEEDRWAKGGGGPGGRSGPTSGDVRLDGGAGVMGAGTLRPGGPGLGFPPHVRTGFAGLPGPPGLMGTPPVLRPPGPVPPPRISGIDADRWQKAPLQQRGPPPPPRVPLPAIHKTANKYEVGKVSDEEEKKQRLVKSVLNKLTPQNFDKLFEQVKEANIDSPDSLTRVISQIFDKALLEPTFCEMYAQFCKALSEEMPSFEHVDENGKPEKITFKRVLLNNCQEEFEKNIKEEEAAKNEEGEEEVDEKERASRRVKARRRMLGNIRFIGELYKKGMLTERIMHECIKRLLGDMENPDEEDVEALCKLMATIGKILDHPKAKPHIDAYMQRIESLSEHQSLSSRIRFGLRDVLDLRKNQWQARRKVDGPKKIEDVHRDAVKERHDAVTNAGRQLLDRSGSRGGSGRRPDVEIPTFRGPQPMRVAQAAPLLFPSGMPARSGPMGGLNRPGPELREEAVIPLPLRREEGDIKLGPQGGYGRLAPGGRPMGGMGPPLRSAPADNAPLLGDRRLGSPVLPQYAGIGREGDKGLRPQGIDRPVDRLSVERNERDRPSFDRSILGRMDSRGASSDRDRFDRFSDRGAERPTERQSEVAEERPGSRPVTPPQISEEELDRKTANIILEYISLKDLNEVISCLKELQGPGYPQQLILKWFITALNQKAALNAPAIVGDLLVALSIREPPIFTSDQLSKGFALVLEQLEDLTVDAPKAPEQAGGYLGRLVGAGILSLSAIGKLIRDGGSEPGSLREFGEGRRVLEGALSFLKAGKGETALTDMWKSSGLKVEDFLEDKMLQDTGRVDSFFESFGILQALKPDPTIEVVTILIHAFVFLHLDRNAQGSLVRKINVPTNLQGSPELLRALMSQLLQSTVQSQKTIDSSMLGPRIIKYSSVLQKTATGKSSRSNQLQYLFAVQHFFDKFLKGGNHSGVLETIFSELYKSETVEDLAFFSWKDDNKENSGKTEAWLNVRHWFDWLEGDIRDREGEED